MTPRGTGSAHSTHASSSSATATSQVHLYLHLRGSLHPPLYLILCLLLLAHDMSRRHWVDGAHGGGGDGARVVCGVAAGQGRRPLCHRRAWIHGRHPSPAGMSLCKQNQSLQSENEKGCSLVQIDQVVISPHPGILMCVQQPCGETLAIITLLQEVGCRLHRCVHG